MKGNAQRKRDQRERERRGLVIVPVEIDEAAVCVALVDAGLIAPHEQDDRKKIGAAIGRIIATLTGDLSTKPVTRDAALFRAGIDRSHDPETGERP